MDKDTPFARLALALGRMAAALFVIAAAISVYEVAMRYVFGMPSTWAHVTVTTMCAVGFALGGAYAMARGEHVRITVLFDRLPRRGRGVAETLALAIGLFYLGGLAWGLWGAAERSIWRFSADGAWRPETTPGPPNWPLPALFKAVFVFATVLFALVVVERLVRVLRGKAT
ncbi:TRAP transporter small permease subunit [Salinarimonas ramus]|uniref:TRAP transporter small permease protein n=1 Tax=Salinarimonas ramus TaxID=690164 RepID=A0A917Q4H0_9HYPH|nr:TRAP transporter small permease [Salinarimonas ramus]GGK20509.1 hypothetical protein GCM10011322_03970 [Salinarimonas ramus]